MRATSSLLIDIETTAPTVELKSLLPVTEMTINELEMELELIRQVYNIFGGIAAYSNSTLDTKVGEAMKQYGDRIQAIECEIFERRVLLQS
jgi:hypothetical protein